MSYYFIKKQTCPFTMQMKHNAKNSEAEEKQKQRGKTTLTPEIHHGIVEPVLLDLIHQWTTNQVACLLKIPTHVRDHLTEASRITTM